MATKTPGKSLQQLVDSPSSTPAAGPAAKKTNTSPLKLALSRSSKGSAKKSFLKQALKLKKKAAKAKVKMLSKKTGDCPFLKDPSNEANHTCLLCGRGLQEHALKGNSSVASSRVQVLESKSQGLQVFRISPSSASSVGGTRIDIFGEGFADSSSASKGTNYSAFAKFGSILSEPLEVISSTHMRCVVPRRRSHFATVLVTVTIDKGKSWSKQHVPFVYEGEVYADSSLGSLLSSKLSLTHQKFEFLHVPNHKLIVLLSLVQSLGKHAI